MATDDIDDLMGGGEDEPLHDILSNKEVEAARKEARERVEKERKSSAKARLIEEEINRLKNEEGLVTGSEEKDKLVHITIDLAEYVDRIMLNGVVYLQGQTYTVPRHVAQSMAEIMFNTWRHQNQVDGKDLRSFYQKKKGEGLSGRAFAA